MTLDKIIYDIEPNNHLLVVNDGNKYYLIDTSSPYSVSEIYTMGGFHFADDWLPLASSYKNVSIGVINDLLKNQYNIPFRISAMIGNDILKRYAIMIDYPNLKIEFELKFERFVGKFSSPQGYYDTCF